MFFSLRLRKSNYWCGPILSKTKFQTLWRRAAGGCKSQRAYAFVVSCFLCFSFWANEFRHTFSCRQHLFCWFKVENVFIRLCCLISTSSQVNFIFNFSAQRSLSKVKRNHQKTCVTNLKIIYKLFQVQDSVLKNRQVNLQCEFATIIVGI